jgi:hypothetical protein
MGPDLVETGAWMLNRRNCKGSANVFLEYIHPYLKDLIFCKKSEGCLWGLQGGRGCVRSPDVGRGGIRFF